MSSMAAASTHVRLFLPRQRHWLCWMPPIQAGHHTRTEGGVPSYLVRTDHMPTGRSLTSGTHTWHTCVSCPVAAPAPGPPTPVADANAPSPAPSPAPAVGLHKGTSAWHSSGSSSPARRAGKSRQLLLPCAAEPRGAAEGLGGSSRITPFAVGTAARSCRFNWGSSAVKRRVELAHPTRWSLPTFP